MRTVSFVSLGCPKNLVDSEKMLGSLAADGIVPVAFDPADPAGSMHADAVVVNTCGFLEASKEESLGVIREAVRLKDAGKVQRVVVAGCLVQRHRAKMLEWAPGIDALIGVFDRDRIVDAVRGPQAETHQSPNARQTLDPHAGPAYWIHANALTKAQSIGVKTTGLTVHGKDGKGVGYFEDDRARLRLTPRHYAYLRIGEGCNQNCAFCTIPSIRGKMRSKPIVSALDELRELLRDGAFEINLIGQDTTSYGDDIGTGWRSDTRSGLPALLAALSDTMTREIGTGWLRLMYAYPSNFRDEYIDAFAQLVAQGRLVPYIDMPLQHASDRVLTAMRRNVSAEHQRTLVDKLRARIPGIAIRTTFIAGFPGEREDDHKRLLDFIAQARFEALGVFEYSREAGTPAGTMEADPDLAVHPEVKARRKHEIMALQQTIAFQRNRDIASAFDERRPADTGQRHDVLIDGPAGTHGVPTSSIPTTGVGAGARLFRGRLRTQAPQIDGITYVHSTQPLASGELVPCTIVGFDGYDLVARPTDQLRGDRPLTVLRAGAR